MSGRFLRLAETERRQVPLTIDGRATFGLEGDTLLVALLTQTDRLRRSEFGDGNRAGFCLMGACQDCWVWTEAGERLRACTTTVTAEMRIVTGAPDGLWADLA